MSWWACTGVIHLLRRDPVWCSRHSAGSAPVTAHRSSHHINLYAVLWHTRTVPHIPARAPWLGSTGLHLSLLDHELHQAPQPQYPHG